MDEKARRELLQDFEELLRSIVDRRLQTVAAATRDLADGLSAAEERHTRRDNDFEGVLVELLALAGKKDAARLTPEELALAVSHATICAARQIQFQRGDANRPGAPLPPAPDADLVHMHTHTEITADKRIEDDSVVFHTQDGKAHVRANIKVKTLVGWVVGGIIGALSAWHMIAEHWPHH